MDKLSSNMMLADGLLDVMMNARGAGLPGYDALFALTIMHLLAEQNTRSLRIPFTTFVDLIGTRLTVNSYSDGEDNSGIEFVLEDIEVVEMMTSNLELDHGTFELGN